MTKVDERAGLPPLDAGARKRLASALDRDGVVPGSLFGSQATGRPGPLSDVDIAIWVDPALSPRERGALRLALADAAARALGTDEVDLVLLNDAPPLLRHRTLRDGELLVERDRLTRVRLCDRRATRVPRHRATARHARGWTPAQARGGSLW